jgi:hypothetical protein
MLRIRGSEGHARIAKKRVLGEEQLDVRGKVLVRLLDGSLGDAGGHGHVPDGLAGAGALHDHVADGGRDGLGVAPHVERVVQPPRRLLRGAHLLVAHPEAGAEAAHVVDGVHDADVHHLPGPLPEHLLDVRGHPADLLLRAGAGARRRGELLVRPRLALVAARDEEAGGVELVPPPAPGARLGLVHLLVHVFGAVPDGGDEAEAVGHVGDGAERLDQRLLGVRPAVDPHPRQRVAALGQRLLRAVEDDAGVERGVVEEGVVAPADAAGVAVLAAAVVGEVAPLAALVDVVRVEDERALGADGVAGGVVEHHLRPAVAVRAEEQVVRGAVHGRRRWSLRTGAGDATRRDARAGSIGFCGGGGAADWRGLVSWRGLADIYRQRRSVGGGRGVRAGVGNRLGLTSRGDLRPAFRSFYLMDGDSPTDLEL